jgi:hypothetical protein
MNEETVTQGKNKQEVIPAPRWIVTHTMRIWLISI